VGAHVHGFRHKPPARSGIAAANAEPLAQLDHEFAIDRFVESACAGACLRRA
jgi:hypothetical protein